MEIFNNLQRPNYEEIVSYGPKWWTEYREMDANYQYAGWTLDFMAKWLDQIVLNQFPAYCDEATLAIFEKLLNIEVDAGESLDERRRTVAAYYSGTGHMSKSSLQQTIKNYTGCDSEITWAEDGVTLQIVIVLDDDNTFSASKVNALLNRQLPAHIDYTMTNVLCTFVLTEDFDFNKMTIRMPVTWWSKTLDGRYSLDGATLLDAELPPYFRERIRAIMENDLATRWPRLAICFTSQNENTAVSQIKHRIRLNWWEELRTLDGNEYLDGTYLLNQDVPPAWGKMLYRTDIDTAEDFGFVMYTPSKALYLDGSVALDGSINLNSGREEL